MVKSLTGMKHRRILFGGAIDLEEGLILNTANDIAPEVENTAWGEWLEQRQISEVLKARLSAHKIVEYAKGSFVLKEYRPNIISRKPNKQTL